MSQFCLDWVPCSLRRYAGYSRPGVQAMDYQRVTRSNATAILADFPRRAGLSATAAVRMGRK